MRFRLPLLRARRAARDELVAYLREPLPPLTVPGRGIFAGVGAAGSDDRAVRSGAWPTST